YRLSEVNRKVCGNVDTIQKLALTLFDTIFAPIRVIWEAYNAPFEDPPSLFDLFVLLLVSPALGVTLAEWEWELEEPRIFNPKNRSDILMMLFYSLIYWAAVVYLVWITFFHR